MRKFGLFLSVLLILVGVGCGGGGSSSQPNNKPPTTTSSLIVSPGTATLALGSGRAFTVKASSGTTPAVTWSVNGIAGGNSGVGTITEKGFYTAPASFPSNNKITVTAAATSNASQKGSATVTVVYPNTNAQAENAPVKLGTSGGNNTDTTTTMCCSGTLGALVHRDGKLFILSDNHVLAKSDKGEAGQAVGQPGLADNNCDAGQVVAHLTQFAPLQSSNVDAALAEVVDGKVATSGAILALGAAGPNSIAAAPPSATLADPATVMANNVGVAKSGRSSGLTCSTLQSVSTSVSVDYDESCGGPKAFTVTFKNQVVVAGGNFSAGGDSGALIVTSDNARPVALLFAGNDTNTVGNAIDDVLKALADPNTKSVPAIVGGGDHPVSCAPTASTESAQASPSSTSLSDSEMRRATALKEKWAAGLMSDPAVRGVAVVESLDQPGQPAIALYVAGTPQRPLPQELEGVRTRVFVPAHSESFTGQPHDWMQPRRRIERQEFDRGLIAKETNAGSLLKQQGVFGVGVGRSQDAPGESALVIYVERGAPHAAIPATIGGVRTRVVEGQRFRAFGWNEKQPARACKAPKTVAPPAPGR